MCFYWNIAICKFVRFRLILCLLTTITLWMLGLNAHAQSLLYWGGGNSDIIGPQVPTGGVGQWDNTIRNWAVDASGTAYTNWQSGAIAVFNAAGGSITNTANLVVGGLSTPGTSSIEFRANVNGLSMTMTNTPVLNLGQNITLTGVQNIQLEGTEGIVLNAPNRSINSRNGRINPLSGTVEISGGTWSMESGRYPNINVFRLAAVRTENMYMNGPFFSCALGLGIFETQSRFGPDASVILRGSAILRHYPAANNTDNFGTLDISNTTAQIQANVNAGASLTINNRFERGTHGTLRFYDLDEANATIRIAATAVGRPADSVTLTYAYNQGGLGANRFVQFVNDRFALAASTVVTNSDLSTWSYNNAGLDLHMDVGTGGQGVFSGQLSGDQTINTLIIGRHNANAGTMDLGGHTLNLNALALANVVTLQNGAISGLGSILYIHGDANYNLNFNTIIGGANDVVISGHRNDFRSVNFGATSDNTYVGVMYVEGYGVNFKNAGKKVTGDMVIGMSSCVNMYNSDQIDDAGVVTVSDRALWFLGGAFASASVQETVKGIQGRGTIVLGAGNNNRSLTVNTAGSDYTFAGRIAGGSTHASAKVEKAGAGTLTLNSTNLYNQPTLVSGGTLLVNGTHVNSTVGRGYSISASGTLGGGGSITLNDGDVTMTSGAIVTPGDGGAGTLNLALGTGSCVISTAVAAAGSGAMVFDVDTLSTSDRIVMSSGTLAIGSGLLELDDFTFTFGSGLDVGVYPLIQTSNAINGTLGANISTKRGLNTLRLILTDGGTDVALEVIPPAGSVFTIF